MGCYSKLMGLSCSQMSNVRAHDVNRAWTQFTQFAGQARQKFLNRVGDSSV